MTYGVIPPVDGLTTDQVMFGLHVNMNRAQARQALTVRRGVVAAFDDKATAFLLSDCGMSDMEVAEWMAARKVKAT